MRTEDEIIKELQTLEEDLELFSRSNYAAGDGDMNAYNEGKINALKWVLGIED